MQILLWAFPISQKFSVRTVLSNVSESPGVIGYLTIALLALLAAVVGIPALATLHQLLAIVQIVLGFCASFILATVSVEVIWSTVVLVELEGGLELVLHGASEASVEKWEGIFRSNWDVTDDAAEKFHEGRLDDRTNAHGESGCR